MTHLTRSLTGAALAAAGVYWFDPASGRRRRARLRERVFSLSACVEDGLDVAARDLAHRTTGLFAELRSLLRRDDSGDDVLVERVRAHIGRVTSHPGSIDVSAADGHVTLTGDVLASEYAPLLHCVRHVRGVKDCSDAPAVHQSAEGVSALQGGRERRPIRFELMQDNWSPAARLLAGVAGTLLALNGYRSRNLTGLLAVAAGGILCARSSTNLSMRRLAGVAGRAIDVRKTITVNAPLERVFETLERYENFPNFMRNVLHVSDHGDGRSHWTVAGPAGTTVEWDAVTTRNELNRLLAWRTVPHAIVEHSGTIRFDPVDGGACTRLDVRMSYSPPAGALGHVVAKLFGADPKTELDEDLLRLKSYLETGRPAHDAARHRAGRVGPESGQPEIR